MGIVASKGKILLFVALQMCRYSLTYFFYIYIFQCKALAQIWNHRFCHVSLLFSTGVKHTHLTASWTCSHISTLLPNSYPLSSGPQTSPAFPLNPVFALLLPCSSCRLGHRSLQLPSSCHTTPHHSPYTHYFQCFFFLFFYLIVHHSFIMTRKTLRLIKRCL